LGSAEKMDASRVKGRPAMMASPELVLMMNPLMTGPFDKSKLELAQSPVPSLYTIKQVIP